MRYTSYAVDWKSCCDGVPQSVVRWLWSCGVRIWEKQRLKSLENIQKADVLKTTTEWYRFTPILSSALWTQICRQLLLAWATSLSLAECLRAASICDVEGTGRKCNIIAGQSVAGSTSRDLGLRIPASAASSHLPCLMTSIWRCLMV